MTKPLYYEDALLFSFTANVVSVMPDGEDSLIELTQSAFYPGGGGQPCDIGMLNSARVSEVFLSDARQLHRVQGTPFKTGDMVSGVLDGEMRLENMRQHSGQHLLSNAVYRVLGGHTIGLHTGHDVNSIDIKGMDAKAFTPDAIREIERLAQRMTLEDLPVTTLLPRTQAEIDALPLRKPTALMENLRIVCMGEIEAVACGGVHVPRTGMIGPIRIVSVQPHAKDARIFFVCGERAYRMDRKNQELLDDVARLTSSAGDALIGYLNSQTDKLTQERARAIELEAQLLPLYVKRYDKQRLPIGPGQWALALLPAVSNNFARQLALQLAAQEAGAALIGVADEDGLLITLATHKGFLHAGNALKALAGALGGRGGGGSDIAFGRLPMCDETLLRTALQQSLTNEE